MSPRVVERITADRDSLVGQAEVDDLADPGVDKFVKLAYLTEAVGQVGGMLVDGTDADEALVRVGALVLAWLEAKA